VQQALWILGMGIVADAYAAKSSSQGYTQSGAGCHLLARKLWFMRSVIQKMGGIGKGVLFWKLFKFLLPANDANVCELSF
jgi:hypothetical protein